MDEWKNLIVSNANELRVTFRDMDKQIFVFDCDLLMFSAIGSCRIVLARKE